MEAVQVRVPKFNEDKETLNQYLRRLQTYQLNIKQYKYDLILKIVNEIMHLKIKFGKLTEFRKVPRSRLLKHPKHVVKVIQKYKNAFELYGLEFNIKKRKGQNIKTQAEYVIYFLRRILKIINYKLYERKDKKNKNGETYYSIFYERND